MDHAMAQPGITDQLVELVIQGCESWAIGADLQSRQQLIQRHPQGSTH